MEFPVESIEAMIHVIRDQRVMIDSDLAKLYGVETKRLNEQVRRNLERFPSDFMFQLTVNEFEVLKSQFATSKRGSGGKQKQPLVFTENGVAMHSSVLSTPPAIQVNIAIMRTFTKLRSFLLQESKVKDELGELRKDTGELFKVVFDKMEYLEEQITPKLPKNRKKIGL